MTERVYIIGIFVLAALIVFLVLLVKFGKGRLTAKIGDKNVGLSFGAEAAKDERMKQVADYMIEKLCTIRQLYRTDYLQLVKAAGVSEDLLMQIDDSRFVDQMLGNIIFSGNGIKSVKSILEKVFLTGQFLSMKPDRLKNLLAESIVENARIYSNDHYFNEIVLGNGERVRRSVSQTEWVDSQARLIPDIMEKVDDIISYARGLYENC